MKASDETHHPGESCLRCPSRHSQLRKLGFRIDESDYVIALAGNPNTGKTTVFNALTGLRMHTGNWPGKTISRAEGGFSYEEKRSRWSIFPGTYSLLSASPDEEVARTFLLFGQPDVTVMVADATCMERNLNLVLQVLQITRRAVLCLNLMDEARANGITIDVRNLARDLGVPVVPCAARSGEGIPELIREISLMAARTTRCRHAACHSMSPVCGRRSTAWRPTCSRFFPNLPQPRWVALRLLEGDRDIMAAVRSGEIGSLAEPVTTTLHQSA
jgi:Fe2+ transport system protein B